MTTVNDFDPSCQFEFPLGISSAVGGLILYRANVREGCSTPGRPIMKVYNPDLGQVIYFRPLCKSWACPYCARRRATGWRIRAEYGCRVLTTDNQVEFVTVTSHERLSPAASLAVLPKAWVKLHKRVNRAAGAAEYFAVPEQHEDGRWHLHLIVAAPSLLKKRWWKDNARQCGLGYQSDVQEVKSAGGVGGYVTKYLTKMLQVSNLPKGFKRVRLSHGWPQDRKPELPENWYLEVLKNDTPLNHEIETARIRGLTVVMADGLSAWDWLENWAEL